MAKRKNTMKILIVEDEPKVAEFLDKGLKEAGYETRVAHDGPEGLKSAMLESYDLLILDIILPSMSGLDLCKKIRKTNPDVPVLFLSALGTTQDKLSGFGSGGDDYIVKPFEFDELLARVKALGKRYSGARHTGPVIKVFDLELDLNKKIARRGDKTIELTGKEFSLLKFLMMNKGAIISRAEIANKVWEIGFDTGTNIVDVYINILRKKIDKDFDHKLIQTRVGMGYYIEAD
jgi:DNA-binding response OmpR family regulator